MKTQDTPKLAPPGAGLPAVELFFARRLFAMKRLLGSRVKFIEAFERERDSILALTRSVDPSLRARRVLIPRLPGLEDSSRHWSVWMTLEHLRITNTAITGAIAALLRGQVPEKPVSTADVKPGEMSSSDVEQAFEASCADFLALVKAAGSLDTKARYAHPWFGPLNGLGWLAMAAMHLGIHRKQIVRILERM